MRVFIPSRISLLAGICCLVFSFTNAHRLLATHNLAGQITAEQNDPNNPNSYLITLTTYTDPAPNNVDRCSADFQIWSVNTPRSLLDEILLVPRNNGQPYTPQANSCDVPNPLAGVQVKGTVKRNTYSFTYVFPGPGQYDIYYYDVARHGSVENISKPTEQAFFVETRLFISPPIIGGNNTPLMLNEPLDDACIGKIWTHNPGGYDPDGDSLAYSISPSYHYDPSVGSPPAPMLASGYVFPDDPQFGNSSLTIDSLTGIITWEVPQQIGIFNFGIRIEEWRNGQLLGYVLRDIAVWVEDCENDPPVIETITDTCVYAGDLLSFEYLAYDPNENDSLYLELNNGVLGNNGPFQLDNPAELSGTVVDPIPGFSFPYSQLPVSTVNNGSIPVDTIKGEVVWQTACDNLRKQFYQIDFFASDNISYSNPNSLNTTLTANKAVVIRVIPPPPVNLSLTKASRALTLEWEPTVCGERVLGYRVYRQVGASGWAQDTICCEQSPDEAGFEMIQFVAGWENTRYVDSLTDLDGILDEEICYTITAVYDVPSIPGLPVLESCGTDLVCTEIKNEPIFLTNDSVAITDAQNGQLFVSWSQPKIDPFFPGPYRYYIYRANNNAFPAIRIGDQGYTDTTYTDESLDTEIRGYNHRVELYDGLGLLVNTSDQTNVGSSIYLTVTGGGNNYIDVEWAEYVPWTNEVYEIWRSEAGSGYSLLTTVMGTGASMHSYRDSSLNPDVEYCYFIRSQGAHYAGGQLIDSVKNPIINDSQEACDFARDDEPPCPPTMAVDGECEGIQHTLKIIKPVLGCDGDTREVTVYGALTPNGPFDPIITLAYSSFASDTLLQFDTRGTNYRCYAASSTDSLGNTSEIGTPACIDFCPALIMSNVFTPNNDGTNDIFEPKIYRDVRLIRIRIFDRWGRVMAETRTDIGALWDGIHQASGKTAQSGVYYYHILYEELSLGGNIQRERKGWVTLLR